VESSIVYSAIAEKCHGHIFLFEQFKTITRSGRLQHARPYNSTRAHHADLRRKQMHAAAATT